MKKPTPTPRQASVLKALRDFFAKHQYAPSHRELMDALGLKGLTTIQASLDELEEKGYITREWKKTRTLALTPKAYEYFLKLD